MFQNHWVAPRLTQLFILQRSINWVLWTPRVVVVKSKLSPCSGSVAMTQLNPIHEKGPLSFKKVFSTWQLKVQDLNFPKFTLQSVIKLILISGLLEAKRVNMSSPNKNIYEHLCLYFLCCRIFIHFGRLTKSKIYLQFCQIIWGLVWVKAMSPVELQPV